MAIGTGWAEGAWVDAGWVAAAWDDVPYVAPVAGGIKIRQINVRPMPPNFLPWQQPVEDEYDKDIIRDLKRPKLRLKRKAKTPDFDAELQSIKMNEEVIKELKRIDEAEKERIKQAKRRKAAIMLLLS